MKHSAGLGRFSRVVGAVAALAGVWLAAGAPLYFM